MKRKVSPYQLTIGLSGDSQTRCTAQVSLSLPVHGKGRSASRIIGIRKRVIQCVLPAGHAADAGNVFAYHTGKVGKESFGWEDGTVDIVTREADQYSPPGIVIS